MRQRARFCLQYRACQTICVICLLEEDIQPRHANVGLIALVD